MLLDKAKGPGGWDKTMPLQPFRHPGVVDGAANVQSSIMNMQNIKQNDLLNLGKQAELDEYNATAGLRQNSYAAEDLQAGLKRVYTLGLLNNVNGIKQFASQWAQQGGPNSVVAQEIIENVDQDFQGMMGHLTPLFSESAQPTEQPSNVREYEFFQQLTPEQRQEYLQVKRATTGIGEVGGVTGIIDKEANTFVPVQTPTGPATLQGEAAAKATLTAAEKGAGRTAELQSELNLKPEVEAAVKTAVVNAEALATRNQTQKSNDVTWAIYNTGMSGLADALGNTDTGPFVGRIPAITANQQISDGAIAAMAPVMKQMFRAAGEGIFTDKDQELLLQMIPKRTDLPEARRAMLQNIDAIVRAKLGITGQDTPQGNVLNFDENGNIVQ